MGQGKNVAGHEVIDVKTSGRNGPVIRKRLLIAAWFLFAPFVFYFNCCMETGYWATCDSLFTGVPAMWLWKEKIIEGFPSLLWNQYVESGYPFLPDIQNGVCYPFRFLFFLLPPVAAYNGLLLLHFSMAGLFTYLYLRSLGCSRIASILAGTVAMFAPTTNLRIVHPTVIFTLVWVPLVLCFLEKSVATKNKKFLVLAAFAFTLQLYACFFQVVLYSGILYVIYLYYRHFTESRGFAAGCREATLASFFFGGLWFLPASLLILPTYEITKFVGRDAMNFEFFTSMSLHPLALLTYLNPHGLGDLTAFLPDTGIREFGTVYPLFGVTTHEHQLYIGILTFFVALYSLRFVRDDRRLAFWWCVWLTTIVFALGRYLPTMAWIFHQIPILGSNRVPARVLFLASFAAIFLSGLTLHRITVAKDQQAEWRRLLHFLIAACIISILLLGGIFSLAGIWEWRYGGEIADRTYNGVPFSEIFSYYHWTNYRLYQPPLFLLITTVAVWCILQASRMRWLIPCLGILLMADLWVYMFPLNSAWFHQVPASEIVTFLKENGTETDRHLLLNEEIAPLYASKERATGLTPWFNAYYHLPSIVGYETFAKPDYFEGQANVSRIPDPERHLADNRLFSRLGMKHLVVADDSGHVVFLRRHCSEYYREVAAFDGFCVFENRQAMPRFHTVTQIRSMLDDVTGQGIDTIRIDALPGTFRPEVTPATVESFEYAAGKATAFLDGREESFVVFAENFYPGWSVTVDGRPATLHVVDDVLMGAFVPPGKHAVTFYYFPVTVGIGLAGVLCGILFSIGLYFYWDAEHARLMSSADGNTVLRMQWKSGHEKRKRPPVRRR